MPFTEHVGWHVSCFLSARRERRPRQLSSLHCSCAHAELEGGQSRGSGLACALPAPSVRRPEPPAASKEWRVASVQSVIKPFPTFRLPRRAGAPTREPLAPHSSIQSFDTESFCLPQCRKSASATEFQPLLCRRLLQALSASRALTHQVTYNLLCKKGATAGSTPNSWAGSSWPWTFSLLLAPPSCYHEPQEEARETSLYFQRRC